MPKISFESALAERLPVPPQGQIDYWDSAVPGFGLRVSQGGGKSWVAMVRDGGRKRRITFGPYPELSLEAARCLLDELLRGAASSPVPATTSLPAPRRRRGRPSRRPAMPPPLTTSVPSSAASGTLPLLERAPYPTVILADQRIQRVNAAAVSLFSAPGPEPLIDQPAHSLVHPADQARFMTQFLSKDMAQWRKPRALRLRLIRFDGSSFPAEIRGGMVSGLDGNAMCQLAILDLTEYDQTVETLRRTIEELGAASQAKTEFLATLSHELYTPLGAMLGILRLLQETGLDTNQQRYAGTALQTVVALRGILNDATDLSKIEARKLELTPTAFELRSQLESVVTLFIASAREKGIALDLHIAPAVPRAVKGDAGRLRQVLVNLVSNAIKFTKIGKVELVVSSLGSRDGRVLLRFEVRDTGIGIPADQRGRLFKAYRQLDQAVTKHRLGMGLGLAISQRLVRLMGSEITIESEFGRGSRFHFTLALLPLESAAIPIMPTPREPIAIESASAEPDHAEFIPTTPTSAKFATTKPAAAADVFAPSSRATRLLLCDDDEITQKVTLAMLHDTPFDIEVVTNGPDAVQRTREGNFDLVLMDVTMPGMSGLDATREIRKLPGKAGRVPIIALTAHALEEDHRRCLEAGMNAYLVKPFSRSALNETIARILTSPENPMPERGVSAEPLVQLDRASLEQLAMDIGVDRVAHLMGDVIDEMQARLERMVAALERGTLTELARDAHSLKSTAKTFGAMALGALAGEIEKAAAEGRAADLALPMQRLPALTRTTLEAFKRYRAT